MSNPERLNWMVERMADRKWFEVYFQRKDQHLERYLMRVWREGIQHDEADPLISCDYRESVLHRGDLVWERGTYHFRLSSVYHASLVRGER